MKNKLSPTLRNLFKATKFWQNNSIILKEIKYFRWIAIIAISFTLLSSIFEGLTLSLIASFLQVLTNPNEPPIQTGIKWFDIGILASQSSSLQRVYRLSALIIVAIWLRSVLTYVSLYYSKLSQVNLLERIRYLIFRQLQNVSLSFYSQHRSGELINTFTREVNELKQAFNVISSLISNSSTILVYVVSMFIISWKLSLITVFLFINLYFGLSTIIKWVREASFAVPKANGKLSSISLESIDGVRTIQGTASQNFELARFERASDEAIEANRKLALVASLVKPVTDGAAASILIGMVIIAFSFLIRTGELKAAALLTFMFILFRLLPLISIVNQCREKLSSFQGSMVNIKELLRTDNKPYLLNGKLQFTGLTQGISFLGINFGYNPEQLILKDVHLTLEKGKTTALVGASGAGKTTLADLVPRFYDPSYGSVMIDGIDLKNFDIDSLRRRMAIVSQDTFIFNNTVRYNVAYGLEIEEISDDQIWEALKLANATEFISDMPHQLDSVLGDRGTRLSGGQKQRIAIARALLRKPDILILDEATSALDSVTEKQIQKSLAKLSQGRTVIAIAHRLSTISQADKVVVLGQGRVIEQGSYQELLGRQGELWKYHQMQYKLSTEEVSPIKKVGSNSH